MSEDIFGIKYLYRMHSGIILISPKLVPLNCRFLQWRHCSSQVVNLNFFRPGATDPDLQLYLNSVWVVHRYSKTRQSCGPYMVSGHASFMFAIIGYWRRERCIHVWRVVQVAFMKSCTDKCCEGLRVLYRTDYCKSSMGVHAAILGVPLIMNSLAAYRSKVYKSQMLTIQFAQRERQAKSKFCPGSLSSLEA